MEIEGWEPDYSPCNAQCPETIFLPFLGKMKGVLLRGMVVHKPIGPQIVKIWRILARNAKQKSLLEKSDKTRVPLGPIGVQALTPWKPCTFIAIKVHGPVTCYAEKFQFIYLCLSNCKKTNQLDSIVWLESKHIFSCGFTQFMQVTQLTSNTNDITISKELWRWRYVVSE